MQEEDVDYGVYLVLHKIISDLKCKNTDERECMELECRFGDKLESGSFSSSCSFAFFNTVMSMLDDFKSWDSVTEWREIIDYFYSVDGKELRSRIEVFEGSPSIETIKKTRETSNVLSLKIPFKNESMFKHVSPPKNIRITTNREEDIDDSNIPDIAEVTTTRIIHRKSYTLKNYIFEISKVWTSNGKDCIVSCQAKKEMETPQYEIEIEMDLSSTFFESKTSNYSSISFIYKIMAVLNNSIHIRL